VQPVPTGTDSAKTIYAKKYFETMIAALGAQSDARAGGDRDLSSAVCDALP
jgi:hypothetical protein